MKENTMGTKYCDWCKKEFNLDHFDQEGFCFIKWNIQAHWGDYINKKNKENPLIKIDRKTGRDIY